MKPNFSDRSLEVTLVLLVRFLKHLNQTGGSNMPLNHLATKTVATIKAKKAYNLLDEIFAHVSQMSNKNSIGQSYMQFSISNKSS